MSDIYGGIPESEKPKDVGEKHSDSVKKGDEELDKMLKVINKNTDEKNKTEAKE
jgi:hypothetical protein